ncbi:MAG: ATP synthase F1 subunit gamma [Candidatus Latescibacteria bacterium]|nr:ATP synthase F1 subunit gamma [Candidatus Latescibacterota bacterium]
MATLRIIRRRIASVKNIQQVTRAMRMVAASKLRRAQEKIVATRPYSRRIGRLMGHLTSVVTDQRRSSFTIGPLGRSTPLLLVERDPRRVCLVVVTADRGLCGSFNNNILRKAMTRVDNYPGAEVSVFPVGRKGRDFFRRRRLRVVTEDVNLFHALDFGHAISLAQRLVDLYVTEQVDRIEVVYNEFKSALQQQPVVEQLLPILPELPEGDAYFIDYLYEPSPEGILDALLPRHLNFQVWRILLESNAAEQGARMTAMENATNNASRLIDDLTLDLNKARQTMITTELMDIVGGAEALK